MSLKAGIVGLPNVGKSSLFSALTSSTVEIANYPFATIDPTVAIVEIKDKRLNEIAKIVNPEKVVYATFSFVDIAGLIAGASKGEGLGNKFLANIRDVDAIIHVVRCFEDNKIIHVSNKIDPKADVEVINLELILSDLSVIENVLKRVAKRAQNTPDKTAKLEYELAQKIEKVLKLGQPARTLDYSDEEKKLLQSWQLLSLKPVLYVANIDQESIKNPTINKYYVELEKIAKQENNKIIPISVQIEYEISLLNTEEKEEFLQEYNLKEPGLDILTREAFSLLNLANYFTAGVKEVRAWTFKKGYTAPQCGGIIHSDFEKKFIKVEIISYNDFIESKGEKNAKEQGKQRLEGKNYLVQDGDICNFKFGK
ncbi:redox-regulated ATPase YchF [Mycoplasma sp. 1654_15]|uniref:redox-regulated ATPase YchF n=1 Tax=Mycoplasma sp. 1654_15 TaxID=2725994 RepID=UPI001448DC74|nr:redox-regulated ATPase YchF [Mycoplasma sp. 1654_15]QJB71086.1 redox-regulated ATPase YchF [Mycoplasma sp. 1654_15]